MNNSSIEQLTLGLEPHYSRMFASIFKHSPRSAARYRAFARQWQKGRFPKRIPLNKKKIPMEKKTSVDWAKNLPQSTIDACIGMKAKGYSRHAIAIALELHPTTIKKILATGGLHNDK